MSTHRRYASMLLTEALERKLRSIAAVALLGTHPTAEMVEMLKQKSRVFLCLDGDPAGRKAAEELRGELGKRTVVVPLPERSKDIGEVLPDEVKYLVLRVYLPRRVQSPKGSRSVAPMREANKKEVV